jgi:hypothetical protein
MLVGELLINPDGAPVRKYDLEELVPVLEKCKYMSSPSIKNDVTAFRYIRRFGVMDGIATLRGCSHWAYVQENKFPGQGLWEHEFSFFFALDPKIVPKPEV